MDEAWGKLVELGVPDGAVRPAEDGDVSPEQAHSLLARVMACGVEVRRAELLLAWLRAWQHHWPRSFDTVFGSTGQAAIAELSKQGLDVNRYLKFRRLAIENLARRL